MSDNWTGMGELVPLIGKDAAEALCRRHGGLALYVPTSPDAGTGKADELRRLLGRSALAALCEAYGGTIITVPNRRRGDPLKADILTLLDRGVAPSEVARRTGVTERYARALARRNRGPRQLSLLR